MNATAPAGVVTGKPLIESDRVEGTAVYDRNAAKLYRIIWIHRFCILATIRNVNWEN